MRSLALPLALLLACGAAPEPPAPATAPPTPNDDAAGAMLQALASARVNAGLPPLARHPVLDRVAEARAEELATGAATAGGVTRTTDRLHREGYVPSHWREASVCCDIDPATLASGRLQFDAELVEGRWEHAAAACADGRDGELCVVLVALPRLTVEREQAAPLADLEQVRELVLGAVNQARRDAELAPLAPDPKLDQVAQAHAEDMLARGFYDHRNPDGDGPRDRVTAAGWPARMVSENIARGLFQATEVVERWLDSSGHRQNILRRSASRHGLGVAIGERGGAVEVLWCEVIATPR